MKQLKKNNKLTKDEIFKTYQLLNLGLDYCISTTKNDKIKSRIKKYNNNTIFKIMDILITHNKSY